MADTLDFDDNISLGSENDDIELDELEQEELLAGDPNLLKEKSREAEMVSAGIGSRSGATKMDTTEDGEISDEDDDEKETFSKRSFKTKSSDDTLMDTEPSHVKRLERAERFGLNTDEIKQNREKVLQLYQSLGITADDSRIRHNALLVHGVENLSTSQIFNYFKKYPPKNLEWIDGVMCVVVYSDSQSAQKSLLNMSKPITEHLSDLNTNNANENQDSSGDTENVSMDVSELPEGKWRLAKQHEKAPQILVRYATTSDVKKTFQKDKPSPIKGLISKSRKEKFHQESLKQAEHNAKQLAVRGRIAVQYEDGDDLFGGTYHEETEPTIINKVKTAAPTTETTETNHKQKKVTPESDSDEDFQADLDDLLQRGITTGIKRPVRKMRADFEEEKLTSKRQKMAEAISSMDVRKKINKQKIDRNLLAYEEFVQEEEKPDLRRKLHRSNY